MAGWMLPIAPISHEVLLAAGFVLGLGFGALASRTNFCAMGAITDQVLLGDTRRLRAWLLAMATALLATQALSAAHLVDPAGSVYVVPELAWFGHLAGGLVFGIGMVLAGGCTSRNLVRAASGDMRAVACLLAVGVSAHLAGPGPLGEVRHAVAAFLAVDFHGTSQTLDALASSRLGLPELMAKALAATAVGGTLVLWCLSDRGFRTSPRNWAGGLGIGLIVTAGWLATSLARDEFALAPVQTGSLTFVRPVADALAMLGVIGEGRGIDFGVTALAGALVGSFLVSVARGHFRMQGFTGPGDVVRVGVGAIFMGVGGVTALGCTIGQGITAAATLSVGAPVTIAALMIGGRIGLWLLDRLATDA